MLAEIRARIDDTDRKLLRLLDQRIEFALRAGRLKAAVGDPVREAEVLDKVASSRGRSSRECKVEYHPSTSAQEFSPPGSPSYR